MTGILKRSAYELAIRKSGAYRYGKYVPHLRHRNKYCRLPCQSRKPCGFPFLTRLPRIYRHSPGQSRLMAAAAPSPSQRSPDKLHPGCVVTETVSAFSALLCFAISLQMGSPTGKYPVFYRETPPAPFCRLRQSPASLSIKKFSAALFRRSGSFHIPFP